MPKVSIIVTVKNEEKYVADLLDSIAKLDYSGDLETIFIDGESTDKTHEIILRYPFVKLIVQKCNLPQGRNIGIKNANGELIAFTDGDCVVDKDWIKNVVKNFGEQPGTGVVGGAFIPAFSHGLVTQFFIYEAGTTLPAKSGFASYDNIGGGNMACRRDVLDKAGGFDERFIQGDDLDLNFRVSNLGYKLFFDNDVKVYHKYRTTFKEALKWGYNCGRFSSLQYRTTKNYTKFLFPFRRTTLLVWGTFLTISVLIQNIPLMLIGVSVFPFYYLSKVARFKGIPYQSRTSLKSRLVVPLIELCVEVMDSLGSLVELVKNPFGQK